MQVDYDPRRISYAQLLEIFWNAHTPTSRSWTRQYMHAIFYHDPQQRKAAETTRDALAEKTGSEIRTAVAPLRSFTLAENYHQKYLLKARSDLSGALSRIYPRNQDFINSTAATRLNGYAGGNGSPEQLAREIDSLGLSPEEQRTLQALVR